MHSVERPFAGQQVALVGKLAVLSRRDVRAVVERLGGTFSAELTPRTAVVVTVGSRTELPSSVTRALTEHELCKVAGLPDVDTLQLCSSTCLT